METQGISVSLYIHKGIKCSGVGRKESGYPSRTAALPVEQWNIISNIYKDIECSVENKKKEQLSISDGRSRKLYVIQ